MLMRVVPVVLPVVLLGGVVVLPLSMPPVDHIPEVKIGIYTRERRNIVTTYSPIDHLKI